jgi:hypothetical protein
MFKNIARMLLLLLPFSGCAGTGESVSTPSPTPESAPAQVSTESPPIPSGWHTIEYGQIALEVPANWTLDGAGPCTGEAIVSPPRARASCPPLPSALIVRSAEGATRTKRSTNEVVVGDFVVRLAGVDGNTTQAVMASVRTR